MALRKIGFLFSVLGVLLSTLALPCLADESATAQGEAALPQNIISVNPFLAAFGWYTGEYDRVINQKYSVALSGSYVALGEEDIDQVIYSGVDIVPRLYPQENAPGGLFFGLRLGIRNTEETVETSIFDPNPNTETFTQTFVAAGFEIGFTYMFGVKKNYALSVGAGVVRLFGDELVDGSLTLPTIRVVNLGFGF